MDSTRVSDYYSAFAKKLRSLLEENSVTKTALAKKLGVKQQTVSQWADGSTAPKLEHLIQLASTFNVSIDELATGIAPENKKVHSNIGLSNSAIEILKRLNNSDAKNKVHNQIVVEFLNIMIERVDTKFYSLSRLARLCMDYIIGAHEPLLEQEELAKQRVIGMDIFVHRDRPNSRNDDLDFRTYQLTKDFENFIENLAKNSKIVELIKSIYIEGDLDVPNFSDRRF